MMQLLRLRGMLPDVGTESALRSANHLELLLVVHAACAFEGATDGGGILLPLLPKQVALNAPRRPLSPLGMIVEKRRISFPLCRQPSLLGVELPVAVRRLDDAHRLLPVLPRAELGLGRADEVELVGRRGGQAARRVVVFEQKDIRRRPRVGGVVRVPPPLEVEALDRERGAAAGGGGVRHLQPVGAVVELHPRDERVEMLLPPVERVGLR
mmetsp:Transcript_15593/g.39129  ORF Transcript_15593/g.39129 Transcript_15593/m.39129 type:complete len:211 (+) Transcript_15593:404-1036(+)